MKLKLTDRAIAALAIPAAGRVYHQDAKLPGLSLCITANGCRTFYRVGRVIGKPTFIRLGAYPGLTVTGARRACQVLNGRIAAGENPAEERRKPAEPTLAELFDHWLNSYARQHRKHWEVDNRRFNRLCKPLAGLRASLVTRQSVASLHRDIGEANGRPSANGILSLLSGVFNRAIIDEAWAGSNPCRGIRRFREASRDRFLLPAEVHPFFVALDSAPVIFRDFFMLAILTGARRRNLESMTWADVRIDDAAWRIPMTKSGQPVVIHLPVKAVEILRRRQAEQAGASPWVFPVDNAVGHLCEIKGAWKKVVTAAGLPDLRCHDLRRTLGSWQAMGGSSLPIIGKSLGHTSLSATAIYARLDNKTVADSVTRATDQILRLAEPVTTEAKL